MIGEKNKIAYLAPEIPALSATFVYNEILGLKDRGYKIVPISVHVPGSKAEEAPAKDLARKTHYLYRESSWVIFLANLTMFAKRPIRYVRALLTVISDALKIGVSTHIGKGLFYRFFAASRVAEIIIKKKCNHLHANFAHIPTDIAMYASKISEVPFSFTSHANDLFERGWLLKEKVERAKFAVTISEYNRRFLSEQGSLKQKIHIVRCGVDRSAFKTRDKKPMEDIFRMGTLGRMVEKKGFDVLIRACKILKDKGVTFHLGIAGDGPQRKYLHDLVNSSDLTGDISFQGPLPHDRVPTWMHELDLFVLPCRKDRQGDMDGIPVVLMEAMLSGVPVVSTRLSGIPELVEDGKTGILAAQDAPEDLALAIIRIHSDEQLRDRLRKNAVSRVETEFDINKNIEKLSSLFNLYG
ncbi:MAG: glycosyltransferase [Desulfobacterales bacterium]|nr:MAG: glycosyltransferase [Desulfobacterales bacterium]